MRLEYLAAAPGLLALMAGIGHEVWGWPEMIGWALVAAYAGAQFYVLRQLVVR